MITDRPLIDENCKQRVKPALLRDVKTEALLVFARTGLERYFDDLDAAGVAFRVGEDADTRYVDDALKSMLTGLQESVVNAGYLHGLSRSARFNSVSNLMYQREKPLIDYFNTLVNTVEHRYSDQKLLLPELLVICVLSTWILEEEKSVSQYPFLLDIDWLELVNRYEMNRGDFEKAGECLIGRTHDVAYEIIQKLKQKKFQVKKSKNVSKRKKR
jgi:hypothetical protein